MRETQICPTYLEGLIDLQYLKDKMAIVLLDEDVTWLLRRSDCLGEVLRQTLLEEQERRKRTPPEIRESLEKVRLWIDDVLIGRKVSKEDE